jgi:hypothetical protein
MCPICQDEDDLIRTRIESFGAQTKRAKERALKCGHIFHAACINRHFFDKNTSCPLCRAPVSDKDREFELTKDIAPFEGLEGYISSSNGGIREFVYPAGLSDERKQKILKKIEQLDLFQRQSPGNKHTFVVPDDQYKTLYVDANGVSHWEL